MAITDQAEALWLGIRAKLIADSAITNIVGQRVYRGMAPANASLPYIVAASVEGADNGADDSDSETVRIELHIWARKDATVTVSTQTVAQGARLKGLIRQSLHWANIGLRCTVETTLGPLPDPNPDMHHFVVVVSAIGQHETLI